MNRVKFIIIILLLIFPIFLVRGSANPNYHVINIGEEVTIKRIPNDQQALNEIVTYTLLAQTMVLISAQSFSVISLIPKLNFFQYLKVFLPFLIAQRAPRKDFSGLIYNALPSKSIPFAVIRAINIENGKVSQTQVSDIDGRYGLLLQPGTYIIEVQHQDYEFPVLDKNISAVQNDNNSYFGGKLKITNETAVNFNIPLNPRVANRGLSINKVRSLIINSSIFKLTQNLYFIYTIFLFSIFMLLSEFNWITLSIVIYYAVFTLMHLISNIRRLPKTWGRVVNALTRSPIKNIFVKFYSSEGKLIDSKITDETGRFQLFLYDGDYFALVQSPNYKIAKGENNMDNQRISFKVNKRAINLNIELEPILSKEATKKSR